MAVGDVVAAITSVSSGAFLDIQPAAGVEWVIHNIYLDTLLSSASLQQYDGVNALTLATGLSGPLVVTNMLFHVNNTTRIRVQNGDSASRLIGYDGVQTK